MYTNKPLTKPQNDQGTKRQRLFEVLFLNVLDGYPDDRVNGHKHVNKAYLYQFTAVNLRYQFLLLTN